MFVRGCTSTLLGHTLESKFACVYDTSLPNSPQQRRATAQASQQEIGGHSEHHNLRLLYRLLVAMR